MINKTIKKLKIMIKTSVEQLAESIGFDIANSDDVAQSDLLNGLCRGLANGMDKQHLEKQMSYIVDKLTPETHYILKELVDFIKLKESENS